MRKKKINILEITNILIKLKLRGGESSRLDIK